MNIHPFKLPLRVWPLALALGGAALGVATGAATSVSVLAQPSSAAKAPISIELLAFGF